MVRWKSSEGAGRRGAGWIGGPPGVSSKTIWVSPISITSPVRSGRVVMRVPFTRVPFWLPSSTIRQEPSPFSMRQWRREAFRSMTDRTFFVDRPMVTGPSETSKDRRFPFSLTIRRGTVPPG
jgi:hypothetical protein